MGTVFSVIRDEDGEIHAMPKRRVSKAAGDIVLHDDLTHRQAVQTQYALRRYEKWLIDNNYRFDYADAYYAWHPVRFYTGKWVWLKRVMVMHCRRNYGDCTEYVILYAPFGESQLLMKYGKKRSATFA